MENSAMYQMAMPLIVSMVGYVRKIMASLFLCLCILSVITIIAAGAPGSWPDTEESREGMLLVLQKETGYKDGKKSYSMKYEYGSLGRLIALPVRVNRNQTAELRTV